MNRKKAFKFVFFIIVALIVIVAAFNLADFVFSGKQKITVKSSQSYYTGSDINATVSVKKTKNNKLIASKITAQLYDKDDKKVKDVKGKYNLDKGEEVSVSLDLPDELETGNYTLKITSKSGLLKDIAKVPVNIINDVKSNVIISLDKGIYKPGDEVNFRALILSKKENTPVQNDVAVYIYDGNNNKVYSNATKTSEYGIVSGSFQLADEVNSGTYKISVVTETQEISKNFTVNPYITPKFEAMITTDKDNYLVGETAQITVSGKYFFGEPVKGAEVKGTIDDKEIVGLTNDEGNFETSYEVTSAQKVNLEFSVTDDSNYMIETSKTIACGTDLFAVEIIPEYGDIASGVDNDLFIITKNINGTPIKTYSSVNVVNNGVTKQVISDENGMGKVTLTKSELDRLKKSEKIYITVSTEDMNGNTIKNEITVPFNTTYSTLIKTDKVKYSSGDDIEITLSSKTNSSAKTIYVLKNNDLIKSISTSEETTNINLEGVTGLVDIVVPNNTTNKNIYYKSNYEYLSGYAKRTIFITPDKTLNIDIETSEEEYKPGDTLNVKFTTTNENNEKVDSALLVSILDEAILSLAENDLSIDNIKLALEDIVLDDGVTAADLYAMVLEESSDVSLQTILLKQKASSPNIVAKTYKKNTDDNLFYGMVLLGIAIISVFIYLLGSNEKIRKAALKIVVPSINVIAIFLILSLYLTEVIDGIISSDIIILLSEIVLAIILYVLFLYKEKDLIFKMIKEFVFIPGSIMILATILIEIISDISSLRYSKIEEAVIVIGILIYAIVFTILIALKRKEELKNRTKAIYNLCMSILKAIAFWGVTAIISGIFDELAFLIVIIAYVLIKKFVFKETKTKLKEGKIVLNLTSAELVGMIVGIGMVLIVLLLIGMYIANSAQSTITDSMASSSSIYDGDMKSAASGFIASGTASSEVSSSHRGDMMSFSAAMDTSTITNSASDSSGAGSSSGIFDFSFDFGTKSEDAEVYEDVVEEMVTTDSIEEVEKEIATEENVRNVFLESLAFIPELITENGVAELNTEISDNITTWNIQTVGNTKEGNVGFASSSFKVFKEFFVDFSLPTNSVVTDQVSIPVTLYNYTDNGLTINVNVKENEWAKIGDYSKTVVVPAQSTNMIYVPIEVIKDGNNTLRVETSSGNISDIVEKTMVVKPNGLEKNEIVSSGMIENNYSQDIIFNEQSIEGTEKIKIKLYASPVVQAIENIEAMLQMPTGCFEQTSSSLYPDILVLKYLRKNDLSNSEIEEKALKYISSGYQKLLTYEVTGEKGGYSLYGNEPAEPVITAFGLMEMDELAEVYEIDENVVKNMKEYLFGVQKVNGSFEYSSTYIGGSASTDETAMNAYIIWALSEVCPDDSRLEKSVKYLEDKIEDTSDSYTLALMANVFVNVGEKSLANEVIKEIMNKVNTTDNGAYITSSVRDYYGTRGYYQNVQTTALTSMALTKLGSNEKTNSEFAKYLVSRKDYRGTWGTTQSTILALKAINDFSENSDIKDQTIVVKFNDEEQKVEIKKDALDVYEFEFENISKENKFSIEMKKGKLTYEIVKNYYQEYETVEKTEDIIVTQNINTEAKVNDVIVQTITVTNNSEYIENGLLEINIPQGCTPIEESLLNLKYEGKIEKYEYNYGKINIYLRAFDKEEQITVDVQYRALYPENVTGAAIRFYDYYYPETEGICMPVKLTVTE